MDDKAKKVLGDMFDKCDAAISKVQAGTMPTKEAFHHLLYHITYAKMSPWLYLGEGDG